MLVYTLDPITLNDVTDTEHAPFVIEGEGDNAIKIFFESEQNKSEFLNTPVHSSDVTASNTLNRVFDEMDENPDTGSIN